MRTASGGRAQAGGAIAEYGIILALVSGVNWLERATRDLDPWTIGAGAAAIVLVIALALKR